MASDFYTPVNSQLIPTGEILRVAGTPFDFTRPTAIGSRFRALGGKPPGYDHNYILRGGGRSLEDVVNVAERQAIEAALRDCDGSREEAAKTLGISATTLWRKMTRLAITYPPV